VGGDEKTEARGHGQIVAAFCDKSVKPETDGASNTLADALADVLAYSGAPQNQMLRAQY
jgi:hypothetical protein